MKKTARDLMHRGLITCKTTTTLGQVATLLTEHHVHALIVTDRDGRPVGVISDFDLLAGEWLSTDEASLATMRALTAGSCSILRISALRRSSIASGVFAGAASPIQPTDSNPAYPCSSIVGTSGR